MRRVFSVYLMSFLIIHSTVLYSELPQGLNIFQVLYTIFDTTAVTMSTLDAFVEDTNRTLSIIEGLIEVIHVDNNVFTQLASTSESLANNLSDFDDDLANIQSTVNSIDTTVSTVNGTIGAINNNVNQLLNQQNNDNSLLLSVSDVLSTDLTLVEDDLATIQTTANSISSGVTGVQTTVNTINTAVSAVNSTVGTINTNVNQLLNAQHEGESVLLSISDELTVKLTDIEDDIAALQTTTNTISTGVTGVQITANAINTAVGTVNSTVNTINTTANTISSGVTGVQTTANAINTVVGTVNGTVNTLNTTANTINTRVNNVLTELAEGDDLLLSIGDVLTDKLLNLDLGATSLSGDAVNELRRDYIALQFYYGVPSSSITTTLANTGSVVTTDSVAFVSTGTNTAGSAKIASKQVVQCKPGHEVYALFSAIFPQGPVANATQWIGMFDTVDGVAVGFNGTTFGILYRNNSVNTIIAQSSFNVDTINGLGASGFNLDKTKLNAFRILYDWYGTSIISFQVLNTDGTWITFHEINNINNGTAAAFSNPCLPMSAQVTNNGNTTDVRIGTTAWRAGGIESGLGKAGVRIFSAERAETVLLTTENYMFSIRNRATFNSKPNKVKVRIVGFGGGNASDITPTILRFYKNATLTSPSYANIDTDSVVEMDTTASNYSGGSLMWVHGSAGLAFEYLSDNSVELILLPGDSISVTANKFLGLASLSLYAVLTWEEYH